jgi:hypothetical protein
VVDLVREKSQQWQWWDNPDISRPLVSIIALTPNDEWEVGRPSEGVAIRVRCAWENTPQGLAKTPITELVKLDLDGQTVMPELISRRRPNGLFEDHYHLLRLAKPSAGGHQVTATVRHRKTGVESQRTIEFVV